MLGLKTIGLFLLVLFCLTAHGQTWQWAKSATSSTSIGSAEGYSVATDASGNVFVTGYFSSPTITFGSITLTNSGGSDVFLTKYNSAGIVLWARSIQGTGTDICYSVTTDVFGNVYISGYFFSPSLICGTVTLTNMGGGDIFLVKYDTSGNVLWAKSASGTGNDEVRSVITDASGNVYITGEFDSPSIIFGTNTVTNTGGLDIFLAKYDASGNALWAKSAQGTTNDWSLSIATDAFKNVYVTGKFTSPSLTFGTNTLTNTGSYNIFLAKYDSSGIVLWAKGAGGTGVDMCYSVATDVANNVYLTGSFSSPSFIIGTHTLTNTGSKDVFIAKYDASGNVLWAESAGGIGYDEGYGIATDTSFNVYIVGGFSNGTINSITFGSVTLPFPSDGKDPMFIIKCDSAGKFFCASALASGGDDILGIATDVFGNVFTCSDFMVNPFIIGSETLPLTGVEDVFVAKANFDCVSTAINEFGSKEKITFYPNPFSTQTIIHTDKIFKAATLTIYNTYGQEVKQIKNISGQEIKLQRDNLLSGLYFIRLRQDNKTFMTDKLVISDI